IAACTSRAAASIFRLRSNCIVMLVDPRLLDEVISVTDAMRPNWRSRGVATEEAIVSGLAPGNDADTDTVGKSTCGSGETGRIRKATIPASAIAMVRSAASGVQAPFHTLSHHDETPCKIAECAKLNRYHVALVPYSLEKLKKTPDGDGTLLDHSLVLSGSPMGD